MVPRAHRGAGPRLGTCAQPDSNSPGTARRPSTSRLDPPELAAAVLINKVLARHCFSLPLGQLRVRFLPIISN
jgi:hypothetical protein